MARCNEVESLRDVVRDLRRWDYRVANDPGLLADQVERLAEAVEDVAMALEDRLIKLETCLPSA